MPGLRPLLLTCDTEEGARRRLRVNFPHDLFWGTIPATLPRSWLDRFPSTVYQASDSTRLSITACFCSHVRIWEEVARSEQGVLVVEDDALLLPDARPLPEAFPGFTFVAAKLNHPETYSKNSTRELKAMSRALPEGVHPVRDDLYSLSGCCAYYVDAPTAQWLLERFMELRFVRPVDGWLRKLMRRHRWPRWLLAPSPFVHVSHSSITRGQFTYYENYFLHRSHAAAQRALEAHGLMDRQTFQRTFGLRAARSRGPSGDPGGDGQGDFGSTGEALAEGLQRTMSSAAVPRLPILQGGQKDHPDWREYIRWVYGEDIPAGLRVDLNAFAWFYWGSPLDRVVRPLSRLTSHDASFPENYAWLGEDPIVPETAFRSYGFFVSRAIPPLTAATLAGPGRLEVLRVKFNERGAAWFYYAPGSGVFLNLEALPVKGRSLVSVGDPPDLGLFDQGVAAYMAARDCSLMVITQRFSDRRVEIVVRGADPDGSLDVTCPFEASVFSTGLFARLPCHCSSGKTLLNCRPEVFAALAPTALSWVSSASFYLSCGRLVVVVLLLMLTLFRQGRGR